MYRNYKSFDFPNQYIPNLIISNQKMFVMIYTQP